MDFVVVGFGLGALGILLGVVMLGVLAPRAHRAATRAAADDAARDLVVAAEHRGTGRALLYAGAAMLLATIGGLAGSLDDRTGALLVTTTATVAAIGILLGGFLQRSRYPMPPRRRSRPAAGTTAPRAALPLKASLPLERENAVLPDTARTATMVPDDIGDTRGTPLPAPSSPPETDTARGLPAANGEPASTDTAPERAGDAPAAAALPASEHGQAADPAHDRERDDSDLAWEEKETVVVGFIVPARPDEASPPRQDDDTGKGEDPS